MIDHVIDQRRRSIGAFEVGRVLPAVQQRMVGPFVFLDHMGPMDLPAGLPKDADVRPHPHIGLSTVTYLFDGEMTHRDSVGAEQAIVPGEVNWMIAGSGITHSERMERIRREGGRLHGMQAWVALPDGQEEIAPAFFHHGLDDLPYYEARGLKARLIAGEAFGAESKVRTHSPMFYVHWQLDEGARVSVPSGHAQRAAYVAAGAVEVEGTTTRLNPGQMAVFAAGSAPVLRALEPSIVMALGGEPVGPRFIEWNFVSSSRERIEQAKADWRAGRMKLPDLDHNEFIPLPGDPPPPAPPAS
jgi:redox-sensitive bicupin YhaK (pirin superfamily)